MDTITINDAKYNERLAQLSDAADVDASIIIKDEARLFLKQCLRFTPPKTKAQGEKAIEKDLRRIFEPADAGFLQHVAETFGTEHVQKWFTNKKGEKYLIDWDRIDINGDDMPEFHQKKRDTRGRVTRAGAYTHDIGRWKERGRLVVGREAFARYLKKVQARVGMLKAGWARAYIAVDGELPAWVERHSARNLGEVVNNLSLPGHPSITMTNRAPGIMDQARTVKNALRARTTAIGRRIKLMASGYSRDMANGIRIASRARRSEA